MVDFVRANSADQDKKLYAELVNIGGVDVYRLRVRVDNTAEFPGGGASGGGLTDTELRAAPVIVDTQLLQGLTLAQLTGLLPLQVDVADDAGRVLGAVSVTGSVAVTGPLTDTQLRNSPVPVSGTVTASGPLTDTQLRASAVPISGTVTANTGLSQPLTDTQLRATPVPVSGTVTANTGLSQPLTDTQLRATPVPVSGSVTANAGTNLNTSLLNLESTQTAMSGKLPATLGQKAMAASLAVALASDQTVIPVNGDIDHDAVNTLKNIQVAGNARACDDPPTAVNAVGDRVRAWFDRFGSSVIRPRRIRESYTAVYRLAETGARLDQTFTYTANTDKQWATLHHTAAATKELRLQQVIVWITLATTVAPQGIIELRELSSATPPATGNPVITPRPHRIGTGAAEATAFYLPTTQGSEAAVNGPLGHWVDDDAVSVATAALQHPQQYNSGGIVLFNAADLPDEVMPPTAPVGTYGGWAVSGRFVGATVMRMTVKMVFTEEVP